MPAPAEARAERGIAVSGTNAKKEGRPKPPLRCCVIQMAFVVIFNAIKLSRFRLTFSELNALHVGNRERAAVLQCDEAVGILGELNRVGVLNIIVDLHRSRPVGRGRRRIGTQMWRFNRPMVKQTP